MKSQSPFILKKRNDKNGIYYVSFKNQLTGSISATRSTGTTLKSKAKQIAFEWYKNGIPQKVETENQSVDSLAVIDTIRKTSISEITTDEIIKELEKRTGDKIIRIQKNSKGSVNAYQFLLDFWDWNKSPYIREKLRKSHSIGKPHALRQYNNIKNHWQKILENKMLCEVTKQDIWDFMKIQENEDICFQTKNDRIRAVTTAMAWAYEHEYITKDISKGFIYFSGQYKERQILSPEIVQALFSFVWEDERAMLANALAMCTGMRANEIESLQLRDLGENCIYLKHSWNAKDGLKSTKNGENRIVFVPFPNIINALKRLAETNPYNNGLDAFIFYATIPNKPLENRIFLKGLRKSLIKIGMKEENAKQYTFHAWRHYFSVYMKDRVNDRILQLQTGHKEIEMLEHYANHKTKTDEERIKNAQKEIFGSVIESLPQFDFSDTQKLYENIKIEYMNKSGIYEHSRQDRNVKSNQN